MHANFGTSLAFTLHYEGGLANDPRDPGGRTNQGVTQRTFSAWLARRGERARDVVRMTAAERDAIYRSGYWDAVGADRLGDGIDLALFDFGVNSGPAQALRAYRAAPEGDGGTAVRRVCARRLSLLHRLGTFRTFGRGWTARVVACEALGVKMAEHARIGVPPDAPAAPQVASMLRAQAREAARRARAATRSGGAIAVAGAGAHAAALTAVPSPTLVLAATAVLLLVAVGAILWRARTARLRASAYAALATA